MKLLDKLTFLGIALSIFAIFLGHYLEGGQSISLVDGSALIIVLGGTLGAGMIQTQVPDFKRSLLDIKWVFKPPVINIDEKLNKIKEWNQSIKTEGLMSLERLARSEQDPILNKGLRFLINGNEIDEIKSIIETQIYLEEEQCMKSVKVFESMGGYAPTIGIIGAVLGLIQVMDHLENPNLLGQGIATAFIATIYGVGLANLFLIPISNKLRSISIQKVREKEILLEAIIAVARGETDSSLDNRVNSYLQYEY